MYKNTESLMRLLFLTVGQVNLRLVWWLWLILGGGRFARTRREQIHAEFEATRSDSYDHSPI